MRNIRLFFTFLSCFVTFSLVAQTQKQLIKVADTYFEDRDYYGASIYYHRAMLLDSNNIDLIYKYAESFRNYNEYPKAEKYYAKVYKLDRGTTYPLALYWQSVMLKHMGDYKNAKKNFKRCERYFKKDKNGFYFKKVVHEQKSCSVAEVLKKDTLPLEVKNLGSTINSTDSEFGAFLSDSTLYFSSLRGKAITENNIVLDSVYVVKIYKSEEQKGNWQTPLELSSQINLPEMHAANTSFSKNKKIVFFTVCDLNYNCKIYYSTFRNGEWQKATPLAANINEEGSVTTHPMFVEFNGKEILLFSSNRKGSMGMMDIWFAWHKGDYTFSEPINAGNNINTIEDEITPFYTSEDSTLYFSSNWHEGLGGFDVFKSKGEPGIWLKPENIKYPINTSTNETYFSKFGSKAFVTSNRKGSITKKGATCCNDIYAIKLPEIIKPKIYTSLEELQRYLPVTLYFHNDEPNPRSKDTITQHNYITTYNQYLKLSDNYKKEYASGLKGEERDDAILDIEDFFEEYVKKGVLDLNQFMPLLLKELEKGTKIELSIKGYASPLSKSDYNVNLTLRRISSLINYISEFNNGIFKSYIDGTAQNGAKLTFNKIPFGEYQSKEEVSDNFNDLKNSVYSRKAALERKIEIMAIRLTEKGKENKGLDGTEIKEAILYIENPIINIDNYAINNNVEVHFTIYNKGNSPLKLFSFETETNALKIVLPEQPILSEQKDVIRVEVPQSVLGSSFNAKIKILSNANPNMHWIEIKKGD
jgi:tetratricopeptide (TPR) repeat protein